MMPRIYIRDQNDEVIDVLDEGQYYNDNMQRFLKGKATVLSFSLVKDANSYELMTTGKNLSFKYDDEDFWLNCVIVEQDELYLTVTAWSLGLEFNNETHGPYKAPKAMTFAEYLAVFDIERILVLGINEVSDKKITHEWDGTESKLARLYSLATVFSAELAFDSELNEDGSLKQITLNVYREHTDTDQGLGQDRRNETFYFGEDIKTIRKTEDKSNLYTAIAASGKDGLTIGGIEREVFDEDGNLLFATYKTQKPGFGDPRKLYAPQARDQFPSNTTGGDRWTLHTAGELEYESAEALLGYMMSELKKNCQPATTWEIEGYIKAKIGDTVRIADEGYKPTLFLEARVIEQEISFSDKTKNKSTFSNVVELESQVDSNLLDQVQKLIEANKTYQYSISTDNGIVFKNNTGTTTLSATVRDGVADVTSEFEISWLKDGTAVGAGADLTVSASDVASKSVYRFNASRGGAVVGGYEVTVSDVSDGEAGVSPIVTPNDNGTLTILDVEGEKVTPDLTGPAGPPGEVDQETIDAITAAAEDAKQAGEAAQGAAEQAELDSATALSNANNAVDKANDASAKADQSQLTADKAKSDAANALTNANDAQATAGTANATANQAKSDAAGAISVAQEAGRNANTALTNANQAIGDASNALAQSALAKSQAEEAINKYLGMGMSSAWSWSADGTDRFTTVYPGENLLTRKNIVKMPANTNNVVIEGTSKVTINSDPIEAYLGIQLKNNDAVSSGEHYTLSYTLKLLTGSITTIGGHMFGYVYGDKTTINGTVVSGSYQNGIPYVFEVGKTYDIVVSLVGDGNKGSFSDGVFIQPNRTGWKTPYTAEICNIKLSNSNIHDIYTPAPSEDPLNAYPSYIGFAIEPSDDPSDYTWIRNPEKVEGEVKVELTEINGELSRKVSQETFNVLNGTVTNQSTLISQNQKDIKAKADQTVVDTINQTVTNQKTAIEQNATNIASKADKSVVDAINGTVSNHSTLINQNAEEIALKANKSVVDTLSGTVSQQGTAITQNANAIKLKADKTTVDNLSGKVTSQATEIAQNAEEIALKADKTTVNGLSNKVDNQATLITQNANAIKLKANQTTVDTLTGRVTTAEGSITTIAGQVDLKANQSTVDTLNNTVNSLNSELTVQAGKISGLTTVTDGHTTKIGALELQAGQFSLSLSSVQSDINNLDKNNRNLWVQKDAQPGYINVATGLVQGPNVNQKEIVSDYIEIDIAKKVWIHYEVELPAGYYGWYGVGFYDTNKTFISRPGWQGSAVTEKTPIVIRREIVKPQNSKYMRISFRSYGNARVKVEQGAEQTYYQLAPEDMATVTALTEVKATVDSLTMTVADKADKTTVTQLANQWQQTTDLANGHTSQISSLGEAINFRITNSDGSVTQIDLANKIISLSGEQINITGNTYISNAVIKTANIADAAITDAKIDSLSANKVTFGTLDGLKANIINIDAKNILADTFTGLTFRGVEFIGSRFINDYTTVPDVTGVSSSGRLDISNGSYLNQYTNSDGTSGMFTIDQRGRLFNSRNTYGIDESYELLPGGLYMHSGDFAGALTANMLTYTPWTEIPLRSGFQPAENNPPSYRVQYNVDGTRTVKFRGQVTTTNAALPNAYFTKNIDYYWGQMPADLLPEKNSFFWGCTGATNLFGGRLVLSLAHEGQLIFNSPHANVNYVSLDGWEYTLEN